MRVSSLIAALGLAAGITGTATTGAQAADCGPGKAGADLSFAEAEEVYRCLADEMVTGYRAGPKRWIPAEYVADYRGWTKASSAPAAPGFHTGRFLVTFVNETGAEAYMQYDGEVEIPAGTVLMKESFSVGDAGDVRIGPLFIMEKQPAGTSPETMDWYYMMVGANGRPQAPNVMTACNECHVQTFGFQGGMGFPVEEVRVSN